VPPPVDAERIQAGWARASLLTQPSAFAIDRDAALQQGASGNPGGLRNYVHSDRLLAGQKALRQVPARRPKPAPSPP
jgi:hypothetical protein